MTLQPPGRELDAAVAEALGILEPGHRERCRWCQTPDRDSWNPHFSRYSTDISCAWKLVETLSFPLKFDLSRVPKTDGRIVHVVEIRDVETGTKWWADSDTAPHAICLAFLKARGKA